MLYKNPQLHKLKATFGSKVS